MGSKQPAIKRTVKDSVFTDLFGNPKYLIQLYRALHPEDRTASEKDIADVTIKNVLADHQYNDLGFRVGDTLLLLLEAQSTWSPNIVVRILMYLMRTYNDYCTEKDLDLYGSAKVALPKPELYVIFTGERKGRPEVISLKDDFFGGQETCVDAKVKVIYDGRPGDIIHQYVTFAKIVSDQVKKHGPTRDAIEETIRLCMDDDVLTDYLRERRVEVMDIMTALFDQDEVTRRYHLRLRREEAARAKVRAEAAANAKVDARVKTAVKAQIQRKLAEARAKAKAEADANKIKAKANAKAMLAKGVALDDVAAWTGLTATEIKKLSKS